MAQITALIAPLAPALAARLDAMGTPSGPGAPQTGARSRQERRSRADRASARAVLDLDAPQLKGAVTHHGKAASRGDPRAVDLEALRRSEVQHRIETVVGAGRSLLALLGLDRAIAAGDGPAQFEGSVTGVWRAPLRLKARMSGAGLDAEAQGTAEPWAQDAQGQRQSERFAASTSRRCSISSRRIALAQNISLSSRVSLAGSKLTFDDLDSAIARLAAARAPCGDARRRKECRRRGRPRRARSRAGLCACDRRGRPRRGRAARRRAC